MTLSYVICLCPIPLSYVSALCLCPMTPSYASVHWLCPMSLCHRSALCCPFSLNYSNMDFLMRMFSEIIHMWMIHMWMISDVFLPRLSCFDLWNLRPGGRSHNIRFRRGVCLLDHKYYVAHTGTRRRIINVMCSCFHSNGMVDTEESADTMNEKKEVSTESGSLCTALTAGSVQSMLTGPVL